MESKIVSFYPEPQGIGQYIHIGHQYRRLETLIATEHLKTKKLVCEASLLTTSNNEKLISDLSQQGYETILDTECAKIGKEGFPKIENKLEWAKAHSRKRPEDISAIVAGDIAKQIADYAVRHKFKRVLAPTHILHSGSQDGWIAADHRLTISLRRALDSAGGQNIAIDYPLQLEYKEFRDTATRVALVGQSGLADLPIENLWLRIANCGSRMTPAAVNQYIAAARHFHKLGKPIVGDYIGGLAGLAILAFGACSGIGHGLGQSEQFIVSSWSKKPKGTGGSPKRCYLPGLDRFLKLSEFEEILKARGAKTLLGCVDSSCCVNGYHSMLQDPLFHFMTQRNRQIADLEKVVEPKRAEHFIRMHLEPAERDARKAKDLTISEDLKKPLLAASKRLDTMRQSTEKLYRTLPNATHSLPVFSSEANQGGQNNQSMESS